MENKGFYIKYEDNQAVKVSTHFDAQRVRRDFPLEDVADLIGAYKTAVAPLLDLCSLAQLTLHEVVDGDALRPGLALSDVTGGMTDDDPLIIKSKNHIESSAGSAQKRPKLSVAIQPIDVQLKSLEDAAEGAFVDVAGLYYAGLAKEDNDTKRLFLRPASLHLLNRLRSEDYRGLRVFGSPGVGKSCLLWAWACDEYLKNKKKVLWIHLTKGSQTSLTLLDENGIFDVTNADEDYVRDSDADIIVVDGVIGNLDRHDRYVISVFNWKSYPNRKSIQLASMQVKINEEDDEYNYIFRFTVAPWTLDEYVSACQNQLFFQTVKSAFEGLLSESTEDLISRKFYFAGCSARWMFNYSVEDVKSKILQHIERCPNVIELLKGVIGEKSADSVNHLWVGYPLEQDRFRKFFVSKYTAREILKAGGSEAVKLAYGIAHGLNNPTLEGWVVEMDFIQQLCHPVDEKVCFHYFSSSQKPVKRSWDVPGAVEFDFSCIGSANQKASPGQIDVDVTKLQASKDSILRGCWLIPMKWNQGGYDVVRLVKKDGQYILVFIQITAAREHSLKLKFFGDLATAMVRSLDIEISRIKIIMMVPDEKTARDFNIRQSQVSNPGLLKNWKCGDSEDMWRHGDEHNQVQVMWFDSKAMR